LEEEMQRRPIAIALALAGTIGLAAAVPGYAADTGDSTNSKTNATASTQSGLPAQPGDSWATDYAARNNGRISRRAYMDEMARRWDAMDRNQQGLTPAEVSRLSGHVDSNAAAPRTGSGVQAGNMGPGNQKGQ
jgi:hypothetical protein